MICVFTAAMWIRCAANYFGDIFIYEYDGDSALLAYLFINLFSYESQDICLKMMSDFNFWGVPMILSFLWYKNLEDMLLIYSIQFCFSGALSDFATMSLLSVFCAFLSCDVDKNVVVIFSSDDEFYLMCLIYEMEVADVCGFHYCYWVVVLLVFFFTKK